MALAHVKGYYLDQEKQYLELLSYVSKVEEEYKAGNISEEVFKEFEHDLEVCKNNYLRISYIMYLFNIPSDKYKKKFKNKKTCNEDTKLFEEGYQNLNVNELAVKNENEYVLKHIKKIIKEAKKNAK